MAVVQDRHSGTAPEIVAGHARRGAFDLDRVIGLPGALLEWSVIPVRIALAVAVLFLALLSDGMESVRLLWAVVLLVVALYTGASALLLGRRYVRRAIALGIAADLALATAVFPAVYYLVSRNDPENLSYAAQPAVALVTLVVVTATMRLRIWLAILVGAFMALVPASLAWALTAEATPVTGVLGDVLTFAATAVVFTIVGRAMQRTRSGFERQVDETRRRRDEAEGRADERDVLAEIGRIISASPDISETYERFADEVRSVLPADRVAINIYELADGTFTTTHVSGLDVPGWEQGSRHSPSQSPLQQVVEERRGLLLDGEAYRSRSTYSSVADGLAVGLRTAIIVPLEHRGDVIGTLSARARDPEAYTGAHLELLDRIGRQIAPVVASARLYTDMERSARERDVFAEIGRVLAASPNIDDVYEAFAGQVSRVLPFERISICTLDHPSGRLRTSYVSGKPVPTLPRGGLRPESNRGILDAVVRDRRPILVSDIKKALDRFPDARHVLDAGIRCGIYVPLISNGQFVATLAVGAATPGAYTEADLDLLVRIGGQIAGTIANAELRARTERQAREEAALAEIGRIITSSLRIEDVYDRFAEQVRALMPAERVSVIEIDPAIAELSIRYVSGLTIPSSGAGTRRRLSRNGLLETVVQSGRALAVADLAELIGSSPGVRPIVEAGVRSVLYSPLRSQGEVIGLLCVASTEAGVHTDYHLELLERISAQIAGALANAMLHERADRQAREESALAEIGRIVNSSLGIEAVYAQFSEQVARILNFDRLAIARIGPGEGEFTISHVTGVEIPGLEVGSIWKLAESPLGPVLKDAETLFLQGAEMNERAAATPGMAEGVAAGIRSSIVVPLIERDRPVGFFSVRALVEDAYTEADAVLARRVAALVSSAITNAELLERSGRQAREEAVLGEIGRIITSTPKIEDVYDRFAEQLRTLMPADRVSVIEVEPGTGELSMRHVSEFSPQSSIFGTTDQWSPNALMEFVVRTGEGLAIPDLRARIRDFPDAQPVLDSGVFSLLYSPLRAQGQVIGLLCVVSTEVDAHTDYHFELLERISAQIAGALANARMHERSDQQAREESALGEIGRIVNSSLDIETVYEQFAEQVRQILPFDRLVIGVRDPDGIHASVSHVTGVVVPGLEVGTVRVISDTNLAPVLERGETLFQQGGRGYERTSQIPGEAQGLVSSLFVPLISRDRPIGFLALRINQEEAYTEAHAVLARRIAALASTAITNSELYERAETEARERAVLAEIGRIVGSSLDIDSVYARFADQVRELIDFDRISISYVDPRRSSVIYAWAEGEPQTGFGIGREIPIKAFRGTRLGTLMRRRRGAVLDESEIVEFLGRLPWANESTARSMIVVPLVSDDRTIAGLTLTSSKPDVYGSRELEIATRVGSQVAGAVANARLHTALREASEELKDINIQKTELMTTVAHELKSPLTALRAFMDLVLEGTAGDVPEKQLELLIKASRSTTRMQNLLNVFSHLEMAEDLSVPLMVTMFDIGTLVTGAIDLLQPSAAQAGVEVKAVGFDDLPLIEGDRQAIEQVVSNLVSNAIKYSHEGGAVEVSCEVRDEDVIVSVTDTGLGISSEDQERMFERFFRGSDPVKRRIRGTGLGLYVSRGLVQRHHGRMWVESEAGRGSVFSFALPFEQPAEEPLGRDTPAA